MKRRDFTIVPKDKKLLDDPKVKEYFEVVNALMHDSEDLRRSMCTMPPIKWFDFKT